MRPRLAMTAAAGPADGPPPLTATAPERHGTGPADGPPSPTATAPERHGVGPLTTVPGEA